MPIQMNIQPIHFFFQLVDFNAGVCLRFPLSCFGVAGFYIRISILWSIYPLHFPKWWTETVKGCSCFTDHFGVFVVFPLTSPCLWSGSAPPAPSAPQRAWSMCACAPQWNYSTARSKLDLLCLHGNQNTYKSMAIFRRRQTSFVRVWTFPVIVAVVCAQR